jgi:hypothetical protein
MLIRIRILLLITVMGICHHWSVNPPGARIYRPSFHEKKPQTLVFSHTKRAFWACFRENWVYNFGLRTPFLSFQATILRLHASIVSVQRSVFSL